MPEVGDQESRVLVKNRWWYEPMDRAWVTTTAKYGRIEGFLQNFQGNVGVSRVVHPPKGKISNNELGKLRRFLGTDVEGR
jgi:hypothetical protein